MAGGRGVVGLEMPGQAGLGQQAHEECEIGLAILCGDRSLHQRLRGLPAERRQRMVIEYARDDAVHVEVLEDQRIAPQLQQRGERFDRERVARQPTIAAGQAEAGAQAVPGARRGARQPQPDRLPEHRRQVELGRRRQQRDFEAERFAHGLAAGKTFRDRLADQFLQDRRRIRAGHFGQADQPLLGGEAGQ